MSWPDNEQRKRQQQEEERRRCILAGLFLIIIGSLVSCTPLPSRTTPTPTVVHPSANLNVYVVAESLNISDTKQSFVYALQAINGSQRWQYMVDGGITSLKELDGLVYMTTTKAIGRNPQNNTVYMRSLLVLQASDGRLLWQYQAKKGEQVNGGPEVESGMVYLGITDQSGQNMVFALRVGDGTLLWRYKVGTSTTLVGKPSITTLEHLQAVNGVVYIGTEEWHGIAYAQGSVYALRANDGTLLWQSHRGIGIGVVNGKVYTFVEVYSGPGSDLTVTSLSVLNASDGSLLWQHAYSGVTDLRDFQEINGVVYLNQPGLLGSDLYAARANDGSVLWHYKTDNLIVQTIVNNGIVYFAEIGSLIQSQQTAALTVDALRASDGTPLWQHRLDNRPMLLDQALLVTNEAVYVNTVDSKYPEPGAVDVLRASDGTPLWNYQAENRDVYGLLVQDGVAYFGTRGVTTTTEGIDGTSGGSVCAYQATNGSKIWCHQTKIGVSWFVLG